MQISALGSNVMPTNAKALPIALALTHIPMEAIARFPIYPSLSIFNFTRGKA